ncbi:ImcF-related family protein [Caballeronia sp. LZ025]|uniref:ImcF-related family protein n=1 Tax=Caballeronia TaxID=1827195 RepID=UPI001FCFE401|nr:MULTISPECIES: ImcF-related family protein [Caballeronia]MDR5735834.1 ImcF-related family protein [Caballeronia sp. LZ025]
MRLNFTLAAGLAVAAAAAVVILFKGGEAGLDSILARWLAVAALAIVFLLVTLAKIVVGRHIRKKKVLREIGSAQIDTVTTTPEPNEDPLRELHERMRQQYGWRWHYRLPWLLVLGQEPTVRRLLPELAENGYVITDSAVLLWNNESSDVAWLRKIGKLRRNRPVDAIVLTLDGAAALSSYLNEELGWDRTLARITEVLNWAAPIFVLDLAGESTASDVTFVIGSEFTSSTDKSVIESALLTLRDSLADLGIKQLGHDLGERFLSQLSKRLDTRAQALAQWIVQLSMWQRHPFPVAGAFFSSWAATKADKLDKHAADQFALWRYLAEGTKRKTGRMTGFHPVTIFSALVLSALGIIAAGMAASGITNAHEMVLTNEAIGSLDRAPDAATRLRALSALQQRIGFYEYRVQHHAPLFSRFGLNHDRAVLDALWTPFAKASRTLLSAPVQQELEARLVDLGQMPTTDLDDQATHIAQSGQAALKTYLMMAEPQHADAAFMTPQLAQYWNPTASLTAGEKLDLSQHLLGSWAEHLQSHPEWRIQPREELIATSRSTLLAVIGVKNSEDTLYQSVLASIGHKYPDQTLASLTAGTDTRGLFRTTATVAGVYTRQAWEGSIEAAMDEAAKHNGVASDWVLGNVNNATGADASSTQTPDALRAALRARYFTDYAEHWQSFMNSMRCDAAPTLPAAIGQLKLIADARQSPLIALMKSLEYQGGAGAQHASLSDTLVGKAQSVFGKKDDVPQTAKADPAGPLGGYFGPVLRLVGQANANTPAAAAAAAAANRSDLSLERFTERITTLRLKLQQISDSPDSDEQARLIAQSLFLGKGSELADTLSYAQLIAASLGEQWAGMGAELFVRPVSQATQTVIQPAQASLNDAWQQSVEASWNKSFAGRYPFANTTNDASLPELARFLRPQGGLIDTFLATQLAGVLQLQGDQWVPVAGGTSSGSVSQAIDPAFLKAINTLQRIAGHMFAQGEPSYRFELKPIPQPGITDTLLTIDAQKLHYYNQIETWSGMAWPTNDPQSAGTRLEWQTETAGTNKRFEFPGRWALVRMLERAHVEPIDTATYQLTWQAKAQFEDTRYAPKTTDAVDQDALTAHGPTANTSADITHPLSYMMRTDVGKGPLELLDLKGFAMPSRIFIKRDTLPKGVKMADGPPPLPKAAIEAARQAETPLPAARGAL